MLETMLEGQALFVVMGTLAAGGVISKCIVNVTLKRLVRAAGNMNKSSHPFMRLVRAKFEHASMISDKVENVKVFVDKYLYEYKVFGVRLHGFRRMETLSAGLCLIVGAAGAGLMYRENGLNDMVWKTGGTGAGLAVLVYLFHLVTDEKYQLDAIRNYMVDYLENVCRHRYEKEKTYQKGIKVLTQEGTAAEFGVMPAAEPNPGREVAAERKEEEAGADWTGWAERTEHASQMGQAELSEQIDRTEHVVRMGQADQQSGQVRTDYGSQTEQLSQVSQMDLADRMDRSDRSELIETVDKPELSESKKGKKHKHSRREREEVSDIHEEARYGNRETFYSKDMHEDPKAAHAAGEKKGTDGPYIVRTREPEAQKSAVSTFHAAERIADEALSAFYASKEKNVSQSEPMGEILAAKAKTKHSEAVREAAAELPAAEFVRETMEPKRHRTPESGAKRERLEDEVDRDLVIRRILEEFMA
ncbi:MAG: hypothetical protein K2P34_07675 [Lachnospiraceae bacterium]|nr:hypothetical protein [Lachnospiraceae bacterium]